jgi:phosphotransferase system HPr (HPr) family protein
MTTVDAVCRDRYGLHPRAALAIQQAAGRYRSRIVIEAAVGTGAATEATSMLGLVGAGVGPGERVRVSADGPDEAEAARAIGDLLDRGVCHP